MIDIQLLDKTRRIASLLHDSDDEKIAFDEVCRVLSEATGSNSIVLSRKGKILGTAHISDVVFPEINKIVPNGSLIDSEINERLLSVLSTKENTSPLTLGLSDEVYKGYRLLIAPIVMKSIRLGTLVLYKNAPEFGIDDIILTEYATTIVGLEMENSLSQEMAEENRKIATARATVSLLTDGEVKAASEVFSELSMMDGIVITSKVAENTGIPGTVIINALRKFEKAGLIETKSSGMKGTYIRILNDAIFEEIKNAVANEE